VALSPAAGAHGELCGLMAIRAAHEAKGNARLKVLVPESAHGTNPSTASLCGYAVESVPATALGRVDMDALKAKLNGDVAAVIARAASNPAAEGVTYELGGPSVYTMREILQLILTETGRDRVLLPIPWFAAGLLGKVGDLMAGILPIAPPITSDQVEMLKSDNVADHGLPGLAEAGVVPTSIEAIVPSYLYRYRKGGQYAPTPAGAF